MERPIGDKFRCAGLTLVVVEDASTAWEDSCGKCVIRLGTCSVLVGVTGCCVDAARTDGKSVHFEHFGVDF